MVLAISTRHLMLILFLANIIPWIVNFFLRFLQANWVNFSNADNYADARDGANASGAAKVQALK